MNVFVLGTGRCGTVTFSKACGHIRNYTTAHESRPGAVGEARFAYPPNHIEIDPRLPWFLGELTTRFPDAFYIHLTRDPEAVALSIARRWGGRGSFARAFGESMLWRGDRDADRLEIARFQVRTMTANIKTVLGYAPVHYMDAKLEDSAMWFPHFWDRIQAVGDLGAALTEFDTHYNASPVHAS